MGQVTSPGFSLRCFHWQSREVEYWCFVVVYFPVPHHLNFCGFVVAWFDADVWRWLKVIGS